MNNKNYFIFAAAIALASCSVDEYMGENPEFTQTTKENIIGFGGGTGSMSRATQNNGDPEVMLDKHFKVYGCKSTATSGTYQKVFDNYWVWYDENTSSSTSSNNNWEYVGEINKQIYGNDATTSVGTLQKAQYIKYWDYSAEHYRFVAGTPYQQVNFTTDNTTKDVTGAKIKNLAGHINPNAEGTPLSTNPVYISNPIQINKNSSTIPKYGEAIPLKFTRLQTKVRVGIYETIPGYKITDIVFYSQGAASAESEADKKNNVTLCSATENYFNGGSKVQATVDYNWENTPSYTLTYAKADGANDEDFVQSNNWYGGKFESGIPAESSNPTGDNAISSLYGTDKDMDASTGYFTVLSTTAATPSALTIKCDFTLESDDNSGEEIKVKGATAAIPAEYCKWGENKMYTYIFKISQETNGTTGRPGSDDPGLFPITFDATAVATDQGTETIVQTPSITTHQAGSVTDNGIEYKTGEKIEITVTDANGAPKENLNTTSGSEGYIAVYKYDSEITEAQLTVSAPTGTNNKQDLKLSPETGTEKNKASFTPNAEGYYAIQYCYNVTEEKTVYKYKVIYVKTASGS